MGKRYVFLLLLTCTILICGCQQKNQPEEKQADSASKTVGNLFYHNYEDACQMKKGSKWSLKDLSLHEEEYPDMYLMMINKLNGNETKITYAGEKKIEYMVTEDGAYIVLLCSEGNPEKVIDLTKDLSVMYSSGSTEESEDDLGIWELN